jgi:uncharacterized protein YcfJ
MKKLNWIVFVALSAMVFAGPAQARKGEYARVLEAKPVYKTVRIAVPRQECWTEEVVQQARPSSDLGGTLLGGLVGGVIGNQIGRGNHNRAAIATGAIVGAAIGHDASSRRGNQNAYVTYQDRCRTVNDYREELRLEGYDVRYLYNGRIYHTRTAHDPGETIPVRVTVTPNY